MWRRLPLVHFSRTGQGPQAVVAQDTTIASVSCWVQVVQDEDRICCGQVAWRVSKSNAKAALSYPAPALAWAEWSSSSGETRVIPCRRAAWTTRSADG